MTPGEPVNLLPGPVAIPPHVRAAFQRPPVSHRAPSFLADTRRIRRRLCELVGARHVQILLGSGTLANDAVAARLAADESSVLIVSNGEFGERLVDHARRFGLAHEVVAAPWGEAPPYAEIERRLAARPELDALWSVHCETSTGVLADLGTLAQIGAAHGVKLCIDAVSSIGTVPVDLRDVHLATGASSKGLASYPGLALVFHNDDIQPSPRIPRYLDLGAYEAADGVPFTHGSNLLHALDAALTRFEAPDGSLDPGPVLARTAAAGRWLRQALSAVGLPLLGHARDASPAVTTMALPATIDSMQVGRRAEEAGFLLSYRSAYLARRNLLQVCLMGEHSGAELGALVELLGKLCGGAQSAPLPAGSARRSPTP